MAAYARYADMPPAVRQELAAMNAHTYDMSDDDRARWFAEHPVSMFTDEAMADIIWASPPCTPPRLAASRVLDDEVDVVDELVALQMRLEGQTLAEIAESLGTTRVRIREVLAAKGVR